MHKTSISILLHVHIIQIVHNASHQCYSHYYNVKTKAQQTYFSHLVTESFKDLSSIFKKHLKSKFFRNKDKDKRKRILLQNSRLFLKHQNQRYPHQPQRTTDRLSTYNYQRDCHYFKSNKICHVQAMTWTGNFMHKIYHDQDISCTRYTMTKIYHVQDTPWPRYIMHKIHHDQDI